MITTLFSMTGSLGERGYTGQYLKFLIELQDNPGWKGPMDVI